MSQDEKFKDDFADFVEQEAIAPARDMDQDFVAKIRRDLHPPMQLVLIKLISLQAFIGFLTMAFCPQFNLSFTHNYELFHWLHQVFGAQICMIFCGGIFVGTGALAAAWFLTVEEIAKIRRARLLYYSALSTLFLSGFMLIGIEIYLDMLGFWLLGAISFGVGGLELSRVLKLKIITVSST